jgi:nucleoside-diphosphate-sugar epimerase
MLKGETKPEDYETTAVEPAVAGTVNILKAAINSPDIKRDVIKSSVVAIAPGEYISEKDAPDGVVIGHESRLPSLSGPYPSDFHAYNASKVAYGLCSRPQAHFRCGKHPPIFCHWQK